MGRRVNVPALVAALFLLAGCAKSAWITVSPENRNEARHAGRLFLTMKNGTEYEMTNFSFTDSTVVGNAFVQNGSLIQTAKVMAVNFNDIKTMKMQLQESTAAGAFVGGVIAGLALALLTIVIVCSSAH